MILQTLPVIVIKVETFHSVYRIRKEASEMFDDYKDIVNIDDLCEMLCLGKNSCYMLLRNGSIRSFRVGRVYKIPKKYVIDYVIKNSQIGA